VVIDSDGVAYRAKIDHTSTPGALGDNPKFNNAASNAKWTKVPNQQLTKLVTNSDGSITEGPIVTFDANLVTDDTIVFAGAHGLQTGDRVKYEIGATPADVAKGVSLSGLSGDTGANEYYVIKISDTEVKLAKSEIDTRTGTIVLNPAGLANRRSHRLVSATAAESPSDTAPTFDPSLSSCRLRRQHVHPPVRSAGRPVRQRRHRSLLRRRRHPDRRSARGRHLRRRQRVGQHLQARGLRRGEEPEHGCSRRHRRSRTHA